MGEKMFENRSRGQKLGKRISYLYLIFLILGFISIIITWKYPGILSSRGISTEYLIGMEAVYIITFLALYLGSTKINKSNTTIIIYGIFGIINLITLNFILILIAILLFIATNDVYNELKEEREENELNYTTNNKRKNISEEPEETEQTKETNKPKNTEETEHIEETENRE